MTSYPPVGGYLVLPSALVCVLGAVGAVGLVRTAGAARLAATGVAAALLVGLLARGVTAGDQGVDALHRAELEGQLRTAIERAHPSLLRRCGVPLVPRGLGWTRGLVAFHLDVRPLAVRSAGTSARGWVGSLSGSGEERLPPRAPKTVRVSLPRDRFVLLSPFGRSRVLAAGG